MPTAHNSITSDGPPRPLALNGAVVPPMWQVHGALILTQMLFGGGAIVGKFGIAKFNPAVFALIRESISGPILLLLAFWKEKSNFCISRKDVPWFLISGFCLFANQIGFIIGVKLSTAVIGSAWQPSQPIFTACIAIILGWEKASMLKISGIIVAFLGAAFMVLTSESNFGKINLEAGDQELAGNVLFFVNCLGTALYVIFSRRLLISYPSITVTGWSYIFGSVQMCIATVIINNIPGGLAFVCPPEEGGDEPSCSAWHVPNNAATILPLLYWILFNSVAAYFLMTWANQYAIPSNVLGYTALQPLTSSLLTVIIRSCGYEGEFSSPGYNLLGGVVIILGLYFLIADSRNQRKKIKIYEDTTQWTLLDGEETHEE